MTTPGTVYLVGAGPGDPGLITVKGQECISLADVVVYDYLANPRLLRHARPDAELIYVGKTAGRHTMPQEEINELLVAQGLAGRCVVRLKGGDPFVFGRGGEEALALREAGVPFEVVPGVTSGIAAPAYAGIPVTQRGVSVAVTFVTGHEDPTKSESSVDWESLARGGGTLVFYMGVAQLPSIAQNLIAGGRPVETPVALVSRGTHPQQTVVEGTLGTIVDRVREAGLRPPAITVIGDVVRLREQLGWFERKPLFGKTVVVTRTRTQESALASELLRMGAEVLCLPTVEIAPPEDLAPLAHAVDGLTKTDWVVLTSPNAVNAFFDAIERNGADSRCLAGCSLAVTGPATAAALRAHGVRTDLMPDTYTSEALGEALCRQQDLRGKRVLLPRSDIAPPDLPDRLRQAGAEVLEVVAYQTVPAPADPAVIEAFREGAVDVVSFTSSSTAQNFAAMMRRELGGLPDRVKYVSIGPETSKTARAENLPIAAEATEHTIAGLVATLAANMGNQTT